MRGQCFFGIDIDKFSEGQLLELVRADKLLNLILFR